MDKIEKIQKLAEEAGFDLMGVTEIACPRVTRRRALSGYLLAMTESGNKLDEWVKNGYYADMKWFAETVEKRKDILKVMPGAKSVICVAMNYFSNKNTIPHSYAIADKCGIRNSGGKIARYARGRDYHKIFDKKLKIFSQKLKEIFPEGNFKYYSDTGPIMDRAFAVRARLGFIGKNTNLITKYGSWVLLGEIITNVDCSIDDNDDFLEPMHQINNCGSCRKCLDVCPTGALEAPYTVDARKCISYLTIEHKGDIPMELRDKMGNRIFGCDACQEVCPFNIGRQKQGSDFELTQKAIAGSVRDLKEILSIKTDEEFLEKFAGSPVMRAKRKGLVRNACVAAGNSGDKSLVPYLKECLNDSEEVIVGHAKWAIEKLEKGI